MVGKLPNEPLLAEALTCQGWWQPCVGPAPGGGVTSLADGPPEPGLSAVRGPLGGRRFSFHTIGFSREAEEGWAPAYSDTAEGEEAGSASRSA